MVLAERLRSAIEAVTTTATPSTVSIGVAGSAHGSGDALVAAADAAMYSTKEAGKNRVVAAD